MKSGTATSSLSSDMGVDDLPVCNLSNQFDAASEGLHGIDATGKPS